MIENLLLLALAFALLLVGAQVFTNGVEWLGHRLGVGESATGSILAAVGTALPETMIPFLAIVDAQLNPGTGAQAAADSVGVGAILGAPFMLATIAMFLIGASVIGFAGRRDNGRGFRVDVPSTRRDLGFFLVGYTLAVVAALVHVVAVQYAIAAALLVLYPLYVYRSLGAGDHVEGASLEALTFGRWLDRATPGTATDHARDPARWLVGLQTLVALGIIVGGAHLFVTEIEWAATAVGIPAAVVALLIAPLATELPEKFNSVLWISRDRDVLALGNVTGAMAFQGTLPVTLGILFTSWDLSLSWGTTGFLNALSAVLALVSGAILYVRVGTAEGEPMRPVPFLLGGAFYLVFIAVVVYHVVVLGVTVAGGH